MFDSLLIANRGEIARRVNRTARELGIRTIAVYSEADADLPHVTEASEAVLLGPADPASSYLNTEAILAAAKNTGAQAIHPGYGFLSEKPGFARDVTEAGIAWIGPSPEAIDAMGDKVNARNLMSANDVPVAPGGGDPVTDATAALAVAESIGFPVMVKAAAGGGGMGMAIAEDAKALEEQAEKIHGFATRLFGSGDLLIERYFPRVRHIEVQILGLPDGRVLALGERECSVQRRHQKLVEETPSPALTDATRARLLEASSRAGEAVNYVGAGTVEYLFDVDSGEFFFLEMNTRLQVEHPITEAVLGIDLVEAQLRVAAGEELGFSDPKPSGHAIELRVNAEDPKRFLPGPGTIDTWVEPTGEGVRVDAGYQAGHTVPRFYDSLMAKVIVHGADRAQAIERAKRAVDGFTITGPKSNLAFHAELLDNPEFNSGDYDTGIVGRMR
ncbi:acetyl-CoA carboxylase biotin carboxylase subunit [Stackebrandtia nassauensis]|uniref:Carbamoyl-phosphate synthase L chain ATP-binding protein n=1 Tax=Stackebrandtia nassauensis (strain DSM 44728 / CIP 108903 / NRRL B-16338 / NBRC 102104 / LLR-40K-21) TaxID=446470 RepID=D3Q1J6_STANL|nr:biotin carboxylase N-terminal domain-containing protein [Stackebrandtia nassauensis]ADD39844.1 Carbamoyl-phosphate synthase L chain ATP- binding protein [Stackebrandtia nassauensis DSM 44728]